MVYEFDVGVSSHDLLKSGVTVDHWTYVQVEAETYYDAALQACQMAYGHDQVVTACRWKI